ncbi:hypothetical protein H0194_04520 [Corynebacterium incognita]|uniref:Holin n=1 Tax=Corynebacterium incognita TaxID=2754725 RepID=A0A7G7CRN3_9CORY|nr:hypothetical protein [Corynebacterium incognita]QNE90249.1 hypothetical protein H0194_04520 [Corynebacterium incognita]
MDAFNKEDWPVRKIAYIVLGALLFIGMTSGLVTQEQLDGWVETFGVVTGYLAVLGLGVAATKTHRGSDDRATNGDNFDALNQSPVDPMALDDLLIKVDQITEALAPASDPVIADGDHPGIYPE